MPIHSTAIIEAGARIHASAEIVKRVDANAGKKGK